MTLSPSPVLRSWLFVLVALVLVMVSSVAVVYSS